MLKSFYKTLDEIPEGDRQHYKKIGDRYVLELDGEHPVQDQNKTLADEKKEEVRKANQRAADAEAEAQRLKDTANKNPTLPTGHVAVPADEAKLLNSIKELGEGDTATAKLESVKTKATEHAALKSENGTLKKSELFRTVADAGIGGKKLRPSALQAADQHAGGLIYEERDVTETKDGKSTTTKQWHVKDGNKWVLLSEYAEANWKDFNLTADAQAQPTGTRVPGQLASDGNTAPSLYSRIREEQKQKQEQQQKESIPLEKRLGQAAA